MLDGLRLKVFNDRYALKDNDGNQIESSPEEMWRRVANAVAGVELTEKAKKEWSEKFYETLQDFKFVPAGRILSGAGSGASVTFYNCFVIPSPEDSRGGIMDSVKTMTEIMSRGGGVGVNISSLRPRNSYVKGVNGVASGSVSFGGLYSFATGLITQGGSRRGALMLILNVDHPDIEEFITAKQESGVLTNANLSVGVSDKFMEAVEKNEDWDLVWDGKVLKTIKASTLWDMICESAWKSGEPGIVFMDRYNKQSNSWYFDEIISTNPCVTGDTLVYTRNGLKKIEDLCKEKSAEIVIDKRLSAKKFSKIESAFETGIKDVYRMETKEGYEIKLTADHKVCTNRGFIPASKLNKGDEILVLSNKGGFGKKGTMELGRLMGWFVGDGHFNTYKKTVNLSFFGEEKKELSPLFVWATNSVLDSGIYSNKYRYFKNLKAIQIKNRDEDRISSVRLWHLFRTYGISPENKLTVPNIVYEGSEETQKGFLQALFTADGHVSGTTEKGLSVRLTSINYSFLQKVQQLLLNFGIFSVVYKNRRKAGFRKLPDSSKNPKDYYCKAQHDLIVSKDCIGIFAEEIGFLVQKKQDKLNQAIQSFSRGPYRTKFCATFSKLVKLGKKKVYDLSEPTTHSFIANGFVVHNCGEQGLPAWGVCNLGSINLLKFIKNGEVDYKNLGETVRIAVRFLDNVIDVTDYYFPENKEVQTKSRRVGIGTMGLADMLIKLKIKYGSDEAIKFCEKLYEFIRDEAYCASIELAREKGSFPLFDAEKYLKGHFINRLPASLQDKIKKDGIRNTTILTQAPTGTTSILAGTSSGVEPVYDFVFTRKDRLGEHEVYHPIYKEYIDEEDEDDLPEYFVTAKELTPTEHIKMQAVIQKFVDQSISKTVNAPKTHTLKDVKDLYKEAYELGCKGVTYFREGSRDDAVLTSKQKDSGGKIGVVEKPSEGLVPRERPMQITGKTYKITTGYGNLYVTVNNDEAGDPFEVFAQIGKAGGFFAAKSEAICRLVSLSLRSGIGAEDIIDQLKGIRGPMPSWSERGMVLSIPDAVAQILEDHMRAPQEKLDLQFSAKPAIKTSPKSIADLGDIPECPSCGSILNMAEGCLTCQSCGYSKCS